MHRGLLKLIPFLRNFRGRVFLFIHGIEAWHPLVPVDRYMLRRVDLFLVNSQFTWDRFVHFNPEFAAAPHTIVRLGVGDPVATAPPPPPGPPAALIVGRMARAEQYSNGHRQLIQVWEAVRARVPDAELWVAGTGDLQSELEALARSVAPAGSVRFFGRVTEEEKEDLIRRCRCLAMPSSGEGFGLVYLEAMRWGRPCLVGDGDAGREVIAPPTAGLAADPRDPQALAEALVELLTPGNRWEQLSIRAKHLYDSNFTFDHFSNRLLASLINL